jgi:SAM-dependent methyltransferase
MGEGPFRGLRTGRRPGLLAALTQRWRGDADERSDPQHELVPTPVAPLDVGRVRFRCNLCGSDCEVPREAISRELPSCGTCGSTVRFRAIVHLLCSALFGRSMALPDLEPRKDIAGIGLSDAECYAQPLAARLSYVNTYFHTEPRLDIARVAPERHAEYDFIIASDVFEHVEPPVARAFDNARRLLKPGGVMVFSVPFSLDGDTVEHFPALHDYRVVETEQGWRLENRDVRGELHVHDNLVFHGGPGSTLEMRLFSRAALEREFARAGFSRVRVADEPCAEFGIEWPEPWSVPMLAWA